MSVFLRAILSPARRCESDGRREAVPCQGGHRSSNAFVGLVLLAAAGLKLYELLADGVISWRGGAMEILRTPIAAELVFGALLLSSKCSPRIRRAVAALFGCFLAVSLYKGLAGFASCGCFGRIPLSPWFSAAINVFVIALILWPPTQAPERRALLPAARRRSLLMVAVAMIFVAGSMKALYPIAEKSETGGITYQRGGRLALLSVEEWAGKPWPLLQYIDRGDELARGQWLAILYRGNCAACQRLLRSYANVPSRDHGGRRVAWVEMPPFSPIVHSIPAEHTHCRLADNVEWVAETPTELLIDWGVVTSVRAARGTFSDASIVTAVHSDSGRTFALSPPPVDLQTSKRQSFYNFLPGEMKCNVL